jgi:hypothetical protein
MSGVHGHMRTTRLLPFAAAADEVCGTGLGFALSSQDAYHEAAPTLSLERAPRSQT